MLEKPGDWSLGREVIGLAEKDFLDFLDHFGGCSHDDRLIGLVYQAEIDGRVNTIDWGRTILDPLNRMGAGVVRLLFLDGLFESLGDIV